ncbi:MAG: putative RNA uridine N3 methyltransferase [Desulfurococcaceae archaeon]
MSLLSVAVGLPTSILGVEHAPFLKLLRTHQVLRYCSIFGVGRVYFYKDAFTSPAEHGEYADLISKAWRYFTTPPYLRRKLVPLDDVLRHVGLLPPLRLASFDVSRIPRDGELRFAYVSVVGGEARADVGAARPFRAVGKCREGIVPVKVVSARKGVAQCLEEGALYRGPLLNFTSSLGELLDLWKARGPIIATDRKGSLPDEAALARLKSSGGAALVLFGSPRHDLFELSKAEGLELEDYAGAVWNTVPGQMVATVRTEEALVITLGIINYALHAADSSR